MTANFNYDPYYDDFDEDKNFMRVLFRPGYSVQARELTQLQTILANQIEKFGNHIFKSGSPILGGKVSLDNKANYIVLLPQYNGIDVDATQFLNKTIVSHNSTKIVKSKVIAIDTSTANPILILKYLSGERFAESDEIRVYGQEIFAELRSNAAVGGSYIAKLQEGIYYFKGQFLKVVPQYLVLEIFYRIGYNTTTINLNPSYKIGIEFTQTIVDEIDDTSLLDPAQGAFNYQAPGAERYAIQTSLAKRTLDSADISTFFEIVRLVNGVKTKEIEYPIYSEIEKTLARRTYDESGNYTVDPFVISLEEGDTANGKFDVILDPGKAYVNGYEFQTIAPTTISVDRAREVSTANSDIPTNYGSSLVLANVRGTLDITSFPSLDIHSVPHTSISFTTAPAYNSTKIGTIYANMIRYNDAYNSDIGNTHTFTVNTFGANTVPITGTLAASGSSPTTIAIPAAFNAGLPLNAYANMYFQITNDAGASLSPILITSSNAATFNLASSLTFIPGSNTFTIQSDVKNAESLVANGGLYIKFAGNIDTDSKDPTTGFVSISEPARTSLVFESPYQAIKANTISNMNFYARKKYSAATTGGKFTITALGTDTFPFLPTTGQVGDSAILNNIICFVRADSVAATIPGYGIAPNTVISLANSNFTVTRVSASQFEVDLNTSTDAIKVDLLVTTKINNAENDTNGVTKRKQLVPIIGGMDLHSLIPYEMNTGGTEGTTVLYSANTSGEVTYFSGGAVFKSIGATNFDNGTVLTDLRTPGKAVSLQVPDVYEIIGIYDSKNTGANVTTAMLSTSVYDITDNYEFDNGQRKTHYDHATIKLKRGYPAPTGKVFVQYRYFKNLSVFSGLFDVDSYAKGSNVTYGEISNFDNKEDKKFISLRSAFDFRPYKVIGGTTLSGALNPEPLEQITADYDYYLPRIDQVVVKSSRDIGVLKGQSAVVPIPPPVDTNDMLIYTLYIPAYTESVKDIRADFKNHRRYTMSDIQAFEDRIRGLEYYVSLTTLEKDAASTKILDNNGLERSKYGILVDNFTSKDTQSTFSDVGYDNRNLIDAGRLYPASLMRTVQLEQSNPILNSGATKVVGYGTKKALILAYTTSEFAKQPYATKSLSIADATFANFKGKTKLFPEFTGDVDTGSTAKVTLNSVQGIDNAFNFINDAFKYVADNNKKWADDKNSPFAQIADSKWYKTLREVDYTKQTSVYLGGRTYGQYAAVNDNTYLTAGAELNQKQISTSTSQVDVGTFVTDLAIQPYMKPKQILFATEGMRPDTIMYSFFDNTNVNKYIVVPNKVTLNTNTTLFSGESILIANTVGDLVANLASLLTGGSSYSAAFVVVSEPGSANVSIINETGKPLAGKYVYGLDTGKYYTVSSVNDHRSGVTRNISTTTITLASDAPSVDITGNTITLIHKSGDAEGFGGQFVVSAYNTTTKVATIVLNTAFDLYPYVPWTNWVYSIGSNKSNKLGQTGGAFYMPKATFRSGERNFRVTESFNNTYDADSISFADKTYNATGLTVNKTTLVDTVLNVDVDRKIVGTQTSDRVVGSVSAGQQLLYAWSTTDPLAQTFFVDPIVYPQGLFLSSVDLFFKAKDDELPVTMQIRPTVNGFPSSDSWWPESVVTKYPAQINVSESPSVSDSSTATNFEFPFPIYLKPGLYAMLVLSDTQDYVLWQAEKGGLTKNNEYVDKQPYMGTLYKSQNTAEWTPFINEDLMFRLNRCVFTKNSIATSYLRNQALESGINYDKLRIITSSIIPDPKITSLEHSVVTTTIQGIKESTYRTLSPAQTYDFSTDDLYAVGYRRKTMFNANDFTLRIDMSTTSDAISPIFSLESAYINVWENYVDNAEINPEDFTIIAPGAGYGNSNVVTITSSTGTGATANLHVDADGKVLSVYVSSPGSGYLDDFTISYPDTGNSLITSNASIVLNSEYDSSGGPCLARYITKPVKLADGYDAGDLRVFLGANKPGSSEVTVFYKLLSDSDATPFKDRPYEKMVCINPTITPSQDIETYREYEYRPSATTNAVTYTGTNGVTYNSFKTFAIKIVLTSSDPAIVPTVKDLRIIATPAE